MARHEEEVEEDNIDPLVAPPHLQPDAIIILPPPSPTALAHSLSLSLTPLKKPCANPIRFLPQFLVSPFYAAK